MTPPDASALLGNQAYENTPQVPLWKLILPTLAFFIALFVQLTALPLFIYDRSCDDLFSSAACAGTLSDDQNTQVESRASVWTTWSMVSLNIVSILVTSSLSNASDAIGRLPVMQGTCAMMALGAAGSAVAEHSSERPIFRRDF